MEMTAGMSSVLFSAQRATDCQYLCETGMSPGSGIYVPRTAD
jgi:hypothetical protein